MSSQEFSVTLTGKQRWDLWMFLYRLGGVKPRDRDGVRNLGAVCDTFGAAEIQARVENLAEGDKFGAKDIADATYPTGSVNLKRLIEYLDTVPDGIDTSTALRLLALGDDLRAARDRKPVLASVPEVGT